jgi:hypothetical protein
MQASCNLNTAQSENFSGNTIINNTGDDCTFATLMQNA